MANSKLLKEAIADAKAVRETAIANAKIALEEAFTPRLQSILSKKLQAEMEEEDDDVEDVEGEFEMGDDEVEENLPPEDPTNADDAELSIDEEDLDIDDDEEIDIDIDDDEDIEIEEDEDIDIELDDDDEIDDDDELDLESIIRELEDDDEEIDTEFDDTDDDEEIDIELDEEEDFDDEELDIDIDEDEDIDNEEDFDDEIDLDEILREMGYDDEEESEDEEDIDDVDTSELESELEEAYSTIKSLKSTINEVNLLNAKLLYANKLFRNYNLTNEQKSKIVENLDRTSSVREVKLVYATLAESMNFSGTERKQKRSISESVGSKRVKSTAPKNREILSESADALKERFKQLANINK